LQEIPLSKISDNPFNSRIRYVQRDIDQLAKSMSQVGLLSPVLVRPKPNDSSSFELVFGHRRLRAARSLKWDSIKAQVKGLSDLEMLNLSVSENLLRKDLSDYEKALSFAKMNREFAMSQEEIGKITGYSRTHICNYIRMLDLFDQSIIERDSSLREKLHSISEHHARVILQLGDTRDRLRALDLVATQKFSVQDLHRVVHRFRTWFEPATSEDDEEPIRFEDEIDDNSQSRSHDIEEIQRILMSECELPHVGDFGAFARLHDVENGFSIYSSFSPENRQEGHSAMTTIKNWFFEVAPHLQVKIKDVHIRFYGKLALATLSADFRSKSAGKPNRMSSRGTILLIRRSRSWKIVHEHWSRSEGHKVAVPIAAT
jgi:ParB/RepB/Spo0J family partition protein